MLIKGYTDHLLKKGWAKMSGSFFIKYGQGEGTRGLDLE